MKYFKYVVVIALLVFCVSQSFAFDGNRKGYCIGLGGGFSPYANPDLHNLDSDYSFSGFGMNFLLSGYNWDNKNLLAWEIFGAISPGDIEKDDLGFLGINGILWYHYLKDASKSFYSILGFGRIFSISVFENTSGSTYGYRTTGFGIVFGGGYEFAKQLQFSAYYVGGKSSDYSLKATNNMIYMSVSFVAY